MHGTRRPLTRPYGQGFGWSSSAGLLAVRGSPSRFAAIRRRSIALVTTALIMPVVTASAVDGVVEINQTCAVSTGCLTGDGPGFPVEITSPGSYRLTSALQSLAADAFFVSAAGVTIDLGGFEIAGPGGQGSLTGIASDEENFITIRNGTVRDFGTCIRVDSYARIEDMTLRGCQSEGVEFVGGGGLVTRNLIVANPGFGLRLGNDTAYGGNTFSGNGTNAAGGVSISTNLCDGKTCPSPHRRRFYLTQSEHNGAAVDETGVCVSGFHFASLWEILDPTILQYDSDLGFSLSDSGSGPPAGLGGSGEAAALGWVRTGGYSASGSTPGTANCAAWTSTDPGIEGTVAWLHTDWDDGVTNGLLIGPGTGPWITQAGVPCFSTEKAWCVED